MHTPDFFQNYENLREWNTEKRKWRMENFETRNFKIETGVVNL